MQSETVHTLNNDFVCIYLETYIVDDLRFSAFLLANVVKVQYRAILNSPYEVSDYTKSSVPLKSSNV